ncbi:MAG: hypothetical protein WCO33_01540 [bacterium]
MLKKILKIVLIVLGSVLAIGALYLFTLFLPEPFYRYSKSYENITVYSDEKFDEGAMTNILKDVSSLIQKSYVYDGDDEFKLYITNSDLMWRYFTNINSNVGGLNYVAFNGSIFLRKADVTNNRLYGPSGKQVGGDRTLTYFMAHEITHSLEYDQLGIGRYPIQTNWLLEGYSEYIAHGSESYKKTLDTYLNTPEPSYAKVYTKDRVLISYLIDVEEVKMSDLWKKVGEYNSILVNAIPDDHPNINDNLSTSW